MGRSPVIGSKLGRLMHIAASNGLNASLDATRTDQAPWQMEAPLSGVGGAPAAPD
jgi:hypothetical protein